MKYLTPPNPNPGHFFFYISSPLMKYMHTYLDSRLFTLHSVFSTTTKYTCRLIFILNIKKKYMHICFAYNYLLWRISFWWCFNWCMYVFSFFMEVLHMMILHINPLKSSGNSWSLSIDWYQLTAIWLQLTALLCWCSFTLYFVLGELLILLFISEVKMFVDPTELKLWKVTHVLNLNKQSKEVCLYRWFMNKGNNNAHTHNKSIQCDCFALMHTADKNPERKLTALKLQMKLTEGSSCHSSARWIFTYKIH